MRGATGETSYARVELNVGCGAGDRKTDMSEVELAATVPLTLAHPDGKVLLSGQIDAIAFDDAGAIDAVVDWKSDVFGIP